MSLYDRALKAHQKQQDMAAERDKQYAEHTGIRIAQMINETFEVYAIPHEGYAIADGLTFYIDHNTDRLMVKNEGWSRWMPASTLEQLGRAIADPPKDDTYSMPVPDDMRQTDIMDNIAASLDTIANALETIAAQARRNEQLA